MPAESEQRYDKSSLKGQIFTDFFDLFCKKIFLPHCLLNIVRKTSQCILNFLTNIFRIPRKFFSDVSLIILKRLRDSVYS